MPAAGSSSRRRRGAGSERPRDLDPPLVAIGKAARQLVGEMIDAAKADRASAVAERRECSVGAGDGRAEGESRQALPSAAQIGPDQYILDHGDCREEADELETSARCRARRSGAASARQIGVPVELDRCPRPAARLPLIRLNSVLLPAPFGPMTAKMRAPTEWRGRRR